MLTDDTMTGVDEEEQSREWMGEVYITNGNM